MDEVFISRPFTALYDMSATRYLGLHRLPKMLHISHRLLL